MGGRRVRVLGWMGGWVGGGMGGWAEDEGEGAGL